MAHVKKVLYIAAVVIALNYVGKAVPQVGALIGK